MPRLESDPCAFPPVLLGERSMAANRTGDWRSQRPRLDRERCTGCLICWKFCPEACVAIAAEIPEIDLAYCKGCGICVVECPAGAIAMEAETVP